MERRLIDMTRDNAQLQDEVQVAQQKAQEATRQLAQVKVSELDMQKLAQANHAMTSMKSEIAALKQKNAELIEDIIVTKNELQKRPVTDEVEALKVQLDTAYQDAEMAARRLADAKMSQMAGQSQTQEQLNQKIKTMQSEIAALDAQNMVLRQDVSQFKRSAENQAKQSMTQQQQLARTQAAAKRALEQQQMQVAAVSQQPLAPQQTQSPQRMVTLSGDEIKQVVSSAGLPLVSSIDRIDRVSGPNFAAFRWDTGVVYGSGEQSRMSNVSAFSQSVQNYINKTKSRCTGSFDQTLTDRMIDGVQVKVADIACVDENANGVAASILFFTHQGMFYALAHEADMNTFETAMDMRDRLANSIGAIF